jgi:hypothetical protein
MRNTHETRIAADVLKGAAAGVAATWLMGRVTTWMYNAESNDVRERENAARGGRTAYVVAAEKTAKLANVHLSEDAQNRAGTAIHWALGIAAGATYAVMRRRWPAAAALRGLPFGAGFYLLMDEIMNPVLGLTPGPGAFPWQAHARGLGGHLTFGLATEVLLAGLDQVA